MHCQSVVNAGGKLQTDLLFGPRLQGIQESMPPHQGLEFPNHLSFGFHLNGHLRNEVFQNLILADSCICNGIETLYNLDFEFLFFFV